jgi:hypothetical protein
VQPPGDPPVTVSDGSLHTHSKFDWVTDNDNDKSIAPKTGNGTGYTTSCSMTATDPITGRPVPVSGVLWTDDEITTDLSPGPGEVKVIITHDPGGLNTGETDPTVVITATLNAAPTIQTNAGYFHAPEGATAAQQMESRYNRRHSRPGNVSEIVVTRGGTKIRDWTPVNGWDPHFTIGFCYQ